MSRCLTSLNWFDANTALILKVFVNFAKEQTDDDVLADVVIGNRPVQTSLTTLQSRVTSPTIQPQPPITHPQPSKTPQQQDKSCDSKPKEGKSKKPKADTVKSKGKDNGEKSNSAAMTRMPQREERPQRKGRSGSSGSDSSNAEVLEESSKSSSSKHRAGSSSKNPSSLFIVDNNTQDSALWSGRVHRMHRKQVQRTDYSQKLFITRCMFVWVFYNAGSDLNMQHGAAKLVGSK